MDKARLAYQKENILVKDRRSVSHISISKIIVAFLVIFTISISGLPQIVPITQATNPTDTKWYLRDQNIGSQDPADTDGTGRTIFCPTATNCKIIFYDATNGDLYFRDCDDATCETGTTTLIDGNTGCALTNCSTTIDAGNYSSIYCPTSDDCKIAYRDNTLSPDHRDLMFADCANETCSSGTIRLLDGSTGCVLTGCSTTANIGNFAEIFCPSASDCKIAYRSSTNADLFFADCSDATCSGGTKNLLDGNTGCKLTNCSTSDDVGNNLSIYCISATDCKISYRDFTISALMFADIDCTDDTCTTLTGITKVLDGSTGCTLTGCDTTRDNGKFTSITCIDDSSTGPVDPELNCKISSQDNTSNDLTFSDCDDATCGTGTITTLDSTPNTGEFTSISCPSDTNCKISYYDVSNTDLRFADCNDGTCSVPVLSKLDGGSSCTLTNCTTSGNRGQYSSNFCPTSDDCKIAYYDTTLGDLRLGDCSSESCSTGSTITLDGNKIINATTGAVTTSLTFGSSSQVYTLVSNVQYPTDTIDGSLGTGTYTLHLQFTNGITSGTLTWNYKVGYCTVSSNCGTKTVHVTSANQSFTSSTTSPQDITVVAGSSLTIPAPTKTKWLYIELAVVSAATGTITVNMNNTSGNNADTYIDIPALTVPEKILIILPLAVIAPPLIRYLKRRRMKRNYVNVEN